MKMQSMTCGQMERLLEIESLGRLGMSLEGRPYVVPIPFYFWKRRIYLPFRLGGRKQKAAQANPAVCFEVDWAAYGLDDFASILLEGNILEVNNRQEAEYARVGLREKYCREGQSGNGAGHVLALKGNAGIWRIDVQQMSGLKASEEGLSWIPLVEDEPEEPETGDPVQRLRSQHSQILAFLEDWVTTYAHPEIQNATEPLEALLVFLEEILIPHTLEEEIFLFPLIKDRMTGPVACMLSEHREMDRYIQAILGQRLSLEQEGLEGEAFNWRVAKPARALLTQLRQHIEKENGVLYPMVEETLDAGLLVALHQRMERWRQGVGYGGS